VFVQAALFLSRELIPDATNRQVAERDPRKTNPQDEEKENLPALQLQ
jgi:hypothetical protein